MSHAYCVLFLMILMLTGNSINKLEFNLQFIWNNEQRPTLIIKVLYYCKLMLLNAENILWKVTFLKVLFFFFNTQFSVVYKGCTNTETHQGICHYSLFCKRCLIYSWCLLSNLLFFSPWLLWWRALHNRLIQLSLFACIKNWRACFSQVWWGK